MNAKLRNIYYCLSWAFKYLKRRDYEAVAIEIRFALFYLLKGSL